MAASSRRGCLCWRALFIALVTVLFACDGGGCIRVRQGDYTFPDKRVLPGAVAARVTTSGLNFLTTRIKALLLTFFEADSEGRAIIPLDSLGVNQISTGLGPLQGSLRDLVLTLDLSSLEVRLLPNTSPARLEIIVRDGELGILEGVLAGEINGGFFSGDLACTLENGSQGRVGLMSFTLALELGTDAAGNLEIEVLPSTFNLQDLALELDTDCNQPECLDGDPIGSTSECGECQSICPLGNVASAVASSLVSTLNSFIDQMLNLLVDDISNLFLDRLLNGRPLAIEGELWFDTWLGPLLQWMKQAYPVGFLGRPASQGFQVDGAGDSLGLKMVFNAGVDSEAHPCLPSMHAERLFTVGERPDFLGLVQTPNGQSVPYDFALGVSSGLFNQALWAVWRSGALCIRADSHDFARISQGSLKVTAQTLDLLLPGVAELAGPTAPVRAVITPRLDRGPDYAELGALRRLGEGGDPLITYRLEEAELALEIFMGEAWLRVLSFEASVLVGIDVIPTETGGLVVEISKLGLDRLRLPSNEIFSTVDLETIAPFVTELALGFLLQSGISFDLGLEEILASTGFPITISLAAMGPSGPQEDWLAMYVQFADAPVPTQVQWPLLHIQPRGLGTAELHAPGLSYAQSFQVKVGPGAWSERLKGPGPHHLRSAPLALKGKWPVEVRVWDAQGYVSAPRELGTVEIGESAP